MRWENDTTYAIIAEIMPRNRYQKLRQLLHVNDNSKKGNQENGGNKLYKVQPVLDHLRNNCILIKLEREHSIKEYIIPAKTKYSGFRQFSKKNPVKWDFRNLVRADHKV